MKQDHIADYIESKAKGYLAKADDKNPRADTMRYRHYSQALFLIGNEIRAGMHLESEA